MRASVVRMAIDDKRKRVVPRMIPLRTNACPAAHPSISTQLALGLHRCRPPALPGSSPSSVGGENQSRPGRYGAHKNPLDWPGKLSAKHQNLEHDDSRSDDKAG